MHAILSVLNILKINETAEVENAIKIMKQSIKEKVIVPYFCFPFHSSNRNTQQYNHCDSPYDSDIIHFINHQRSIFLTKQTKNHSHVFYQVLIFPTAEQHFID